MHNINVWNTWPDCTGMHTFGTAQCVTSHMKLPSSIYHPPVINVMKVNVHKDTDWRKDITSDTQGVKYTICMHAVCVNHGLIHV